MKIVDENRWKIGQRPAFMLKLTANSNFLQIACCTFFLSCSLQVVFRILMSNKKSSESWKVCQFRFVKKRWKKGKICKMLHSKLSNFSKQQCLFGWNERRLINMRWYCFSYNVKAIMKDIFYFYKRSVCLCLSNSLYQIKQSPSFHFSSTKFGLYSVQIHISWELLKVSGLKWFVQCWANKNTVSLDKKKNWIAVAFADEHEVES